MVCWRLVKVCGWSVCWVIRLQVDRSDPKQHFTGGKQFRHLERSSNKSAESEWPTTYSTLFLCKYTRCANVLSYNLLPLMSVSVSIKEVEVGAKTPRTLWQNISGSLSNPANSDKLARGKYLLRGRLQSQLWLSNIKQFDLMTTHSSFLPHSAKLKIDLIWGRSSLVTEQCLVIEHYLLTTTIILIIIDGQEI